MGKVSVEFDQNTPRYVCTDCNYCSSVMGMRLCEVNNRGYCSFVKENYGYTLSPHYRSFICNFFICDEIANQCISNDSFKLYLRERERYARWLKWENESLQKLLFESGINLINDLHGTVAALQYIILN